MHDLKQKSWGRTGRALNQPIFRRRVQIYCTTLVCMSDFFLARNLLSDFYDDLYIMQKTENAFR
jgi:hypothetical protein